MLHKELLVIYKKKMCRKLRVLADFAAIFPRNEWGLVGKTPQASMRESPYHDKDKVSPCRCQDPVLFTLSTILCPHCALQ